MEADDLRAAIIVPVPPRVEPADEPRRASVQGSAVVVGLVLAMFAAVGVARLAGWV